MAKENISGIRSISEMSIISAKSERHRNNNNKDGVNEHQSNNVNGI
jgi:hypothetical protein